MRCAACDSAVRHALGLAAKATLRAADRPTPEAIESFNSAVAAQLAAVKVSWACPNCRNPGAPDSQLSLPGLTLPPAVPEAPALRTTNERKGTRMARGGLEP